MPILNDLTTEEASQLLMLLDHGVLLSALRKVWEEERTYWRRHGDAEALNGNPSMARLIEYAARAAEANQFEQIIRKAVCL